MPHALPAGAPIRRDEASLARVAFARADWDAVAAAHALRVPFDDPEASAADLAREAASGRLLVVSISQNDSRTGSVFLRIERDGARRVAVIVAASCDLTPGSAFGPGLSGLERIAANLGCDLIRAHTSRPGVAACLRSAGWGISEIILTKAIT